MQGKLIINVLFLWKTLNLSKLKTVEPGTPKRLKLRIMSRALSRQTYVIGSLPLFKSRLKTDLFKFFFIFLYYSTCRLKNIQI